MKEKQIFVIIGKTLSGKTTLIESIRDKMNAEFIISFTSRPMRDGEINGLDYHFVDYQEALSAILNGKVIAPREYQPDATQGLFPWYYGIYLEHIEKSDKDKVVIITDTEGLIDVRYYFDNVTAIYLELSKEEQSKRFNSRQEDLTYEQIRRIKDDDIQFTPAVADYIIDASKSKAQIKKEVLKLING